MDPTAPTRSPRSSTALPRPSRRPENTTARLLGNEAAIAASATTGSGSTPSARTLSRARSGHSSLALALTRRRTCSAEVAGDPVLAHVCLTVTLNKVRTSTRARFDPVLPLRDIASPLLLAHEDCPRARARRLLCPTRRQRPLVMPRGGRRATATRDVILVTTRVHSMYHHLRSSVMLDLPAPSSSTCNQLPGHTPG